MKKEIRLPLAIFLVASLLGTGCKDSSGDGDGDGDAGGTGTDTETGESAGHNPDNVLPLDDLAIPPGDIPVGEAPMFVTIGFDDNGYEDSLTWILDFLKDKQNPDGTPTRLSFYMATGYVYDDPEIDSPYAEPNPSENLDALKAAWRRAYDEGHEIGSHTQHHFMGYSQWDPTFDEANIFTAEQWATEMQASLDVLTQPEHGLEIPLTDIVGFRTPFLGYTDATFVAQEQIGFGYDCSIEDGWQSGPLQNGTNYLWPYNLANGSPGDKVIVEWGGETPRETLGSHATIMEMPVHPIVIPPDYRAAEYGIPEGLRAKCKAAADYFEEADGKFTGLDYNLWASSSETMFDLTKEEFVATLKYTLDLRLKGNRAPMMFGAHTDYYSQRNTEFIPANSTWQDRRVAIEEFLDYAMAKPEVIIVPIKSVYEWMSDHGRE